MFFRHGFDFGPRKASFFRRGDFKYLILGLLKDKPRHGYEIIRELEERFQGFYAPSPGIVYPTLQYLEELGFVTVLEEEGKKVYTITEEGKKFLADKEEVTEEIRNHMKNWWDPGMREQLHDVMQELRGLGRLLGRLANRAGSETLKQIREILARARKEIEALLERDKPA